MAAKKKAAKKTAKKAAKKAAPKAASSACKVVTVKGPRGGKSYKRKLCWGVKTVKAHPGLVITSNSPPR